MAAGSALFAQFKEGLGWQDEKRAGGEAGPCCQAMCGRQVADRMET